MKLEQTEQTKVLISTPDGEMPAVLVTPTQPNRKPAVLLLMEAFGVTPHIRDVAARIAEEGYVVLVPDFYYRELPSTNKFGYDEVESARAMTLRLDLKATVEDIAAAIAHLKSRSDVNPDRVGVTGFCLGGGLAFLTACKLPNDIAVAASFYGFYGIPVEQWYEMMPDLTAPIYFFLGETDPFIPLDIVNQIETRLQELGKTYSLKIYSDATHGFFCNERSDYNPVAAEDAWHELTRFFDRHLREKTEY
jgi:carboxymethylenebutenolidase